MGSCCGVENVAQPVSQFDHEGFPLSDEGKIVPMEATDFEQMRLLGLGGFAYVHLVKHKESGELFAMKHMSKAHLLNKKAVPMVWHEREIMTQLSEVPNPFLCQLRFCFTDPKEVYLVMQFVSGGDLSCLLHLQGKTQRAIVRRSVSRNIPLPDDLRSVLSFNAHTTNLTQTIQEMDEARERAAKMVFELESDGRTIDTDDYSHSVLQKNVLESPNYHKASSNDIDTNTLKLSFAPSKLTQMNWVPQGFDEYTCKLITAEIILALEQLHKANILYRDLKPKNMLVTNDGHIVLSDFGLGTLLEARKGYMTKHRAGTPGYMAPEMAAGASYGFSVDVFALGVTVYELFHGVSPLDAKKFVKLSKENARDPNLWQYSMSPHLTLLGQDFIAGLLCLDPFDRLGCSAEPISGGCVGDLKAHAWFDDVDWVNVIRRKRPIPKLLERAEQYMKTAEEKAMSAITLAPKIKPAYQEYFENFAWDCRTAGRLEIPRLSRSGDLGAQLNTSNIELKNQKKKSRYKNQDKHQSFIVPISGMESTDGRSTLVSNMQFSQVPGFASQMGSQLSTPGSKSSARRLFKDPRDAVADAESDSARGEQKKQAKGSALLTVPPPGLAEFSTKLDQGSKPSGMIRQPAKTPERI